MLELFADLPEALQNNYNFPFRCNYRPLVSKPILPNISSEKSGNAEDALKKVIRWMDLKISLRNFFI